VGGTYDKLLLVGGEMHTRFGGETEKKRPLGRPRLRREDDIKMNLKEIGWERGLDSYGSRKGTSGGFNAVVRFRV
jgi:hypothetical protein